MDRALAAESQRKTTGYAPPVNYRYAQPLNLANGQTEALVNQANEGDKNAPFRQFHLLRYDNGGNLLHDAPVQFAYNRSFFTRCPLVDAEGRVVGAVNIFGDGDGKKEFMDPDENRVAVVVTDEQGAIWAQFDWTVNGSAMRAAEPLLARREGETVKLWTLNTQKMLKPQYESWTWTREPQTVKTTLEGSLAETDLSSLSTKLGLVNNGEAMGWYYPSRSRYPDGVANAVMQACW